MISLHISTGVVPGQIQSIVVIRIIAIVLESALSTAALLTATLLILVS